MALTCRWLGNGFVEVSSETYGPGNHYNVDLKEAPPTCPCENYTLGGNTNCKHIKAAKEYAASIGYQV